MTSGFKITACVLACICSLLFAYVHISDVNYENMKANFHVVEIDNKKRSTKKTDDKRIDYDNNNIKLKEADIDQMVNASFKVNVEAKVHLHDKILKTEGDRDLAGSGSATAIFERNDFVYFLTCAHVVDFSEDNERVTIEMLSRTVTVDYRTRMGTEKILCQVIFEDTERDVALLLTKESMLNYKKNGYTIMRDFADSKDVRQGDYTCVMGYPNGVGPVYTAGIVSMSNFNAHEPGYHFRDVLSDATISPGNSGGAMYVLKNGKPMLAGMSQYSYGGLDNLYGYALIKDVKTSFYAHLHGWLMEDIKD